MLKAQKTKINISKLIKLSTLLRLRHTRCRHINFSGCKNATEPKVMEGAEVIKGGKPVLPNSAHWTLQAKEPLYIFLNRLLHRVIIRV
jgi:hypothetical protein